jgi:hypothetical protein
MFSSLLLAIQFSRTNLVRQSDFSSVRGGQSISLFQCVKLFVSLFSLISPTCVTTSATGEGLYSQSRAGQGDFFLFLHFFDSPVGEFAALVRLRPLIAL